MQACLAETQYFPQENLAELKQHVLSQPARRRTTEIEVVNETTLTGVRRLLSRQEGGVAALNFASAKNPGGGFLNGSQAQEESLARSSALYASLQRAFVFYERHRAMSSCLYSDAMIFSPGCPIFRDDEGELLSEPMSATFITSAAPNAGAIENNAPLETPLIPQVLRQRAEFVLALAAAHDYENLILGAWGCGVFRNDPRTVADAFAVHLRGNWSGRFSRVIFSVLDRSLEQETLGAFKTALL